MVLRINYFYLVIFSSIFDYHKDLRLKRIFLALALVLCSHGYSHRIDDLIVLDIEEGEVSYQNEQLTAEYKAALKRQRLRKLKAMPWHQRFFVFVKSGIQHIIPKGVDHILFVLGLFFSSIVVRALFWQVTAFTLAHTITLGLAALGLVNVPCIYCRTPNCVVYCLDWHRKLLFQKNSCLATIPCFCFWLITWFGVCIGLKDLWYS